MNICIIGAGPAGIVTALFLARQGISSCVLDKAIFPRPKACADNITGNTIRILKEMEPHIFEDLPKQAQLLDIQGVKAYAPNGSKLTLDFLPLEKETTQPSCYAIRREDLDDYLLQKAKQNPLIEIKEGCWVKDIQQNNKDITVLTNDGRRMHSQMLVLAAGSNTNFVQKLTGKKVLPHQRAVGLRAYFEGVENMAPQYCELFIHSKLLPGGLYITPLKDGQVNVNIVMRSDVVQKRKINLNTLLPQILKEHIILKDKFKHARQIGTAQGSSLLLGTQTRPVSGERWLAVGDAAGLIDLLSANGLPQALLSAKLAAEQISQCVHQKDFSAAFLKNYDQKLHKRIESYLKMSRLMAPFISQRWFLGGVVCLMNWLCKRFEKNEALRNLIYDPKVEKTLRKPAFYYRLFFGLKNREAIKHPA